jgi:hypothetical protein
MFDVAAQWANISVDSWVGNARGLTDGDDACSYDPAAWCSLAVNAGAAACRIGYEWLEYVVTGRIAERVSTDEFSIGVRSPGTRTLELIGPLQSVLRPIQTIEVSRVLIVPSVLVGSAATFRLQVDATGCRGGLYRGAVDVRPRDVNQPPVTVIVQVP